jgi:hypothetical protein
MILNTEFMMPQQVIDLLLCPGANSVLSVVACGKPLRVYVSKKGGSQSGFGIIPRFMQEV